MAHLHSTIHPRPNLAEALAGFLVAFGFVGHRVVVFEGDPSAFAIAIRGADVLLVDDGMEPFLQRDWQAVARRELKPGGRILLHRRADYTLNELR